MKYERKKASSPEDVFSLLENWKNRRQENFLAISLDSGNCVIKLHHITKGLVNKTLVHPRECFYPVIKNYAAAVIFVHNHPSGNLDPSDEDEDVTEKLCMAGAILGIQVLDHIIISRKGFYSFGKNYKIKNSFNSFGKDKLDCFAYRIAAEGFRI